jgi:PAS domain S-box-containing protein
MNIFTEEKTERERYLSAIVDIQNHLLSSLSPDYNFILRCLGEASQASRVYFFKNSRNSKGELLMSQEAEWCDEGVAETISNTQFQNLPYSTFEELEEILSGGNVVNKVAPELNVPIQEFLKAQGVRSLLILPLSVNNTFTGFFGFDNCREVRLYTDSEITLLQSATLAVSTALERTIAKQQLIESEQRFRSLADNIPGVVYRCCNDDDWTMHFISHVMLSVTGFGPEEFILKNRSFNSLIHPEDRPRVKAITRFALKARLPFNLEYRLFCADGSIKWVYEKGQGIFNESGHLLWIDGVIFDITEKKIAEQEREILLKELQNALNEKKELDEIRSELLSIVAHDINNPLTAILLKTDLLSLYRAKLPEQEIQSTIEAIASSAAKIKEITADLLLSERIRSGKLAVSLQPASLHGAVQDVIKTLRPWADTKKIAFEYEIENDFGVLADPTLLQEALENIISNAIKFSPYSSTVRISTFKSDGTVSCAISDEGPGISTEDQKQLFKRFVKLSARPTGGESSTGLGLSITKRLVELMNGKIFYEPRANSGATFIIEIPTAYHTFSSLVEHLAA